MKLRELIELLIFNKKNIFLVGLLLATVLTTGCGGEKELILQKVQLPIVIHKAHLVVAEPTKTIEYEPGKIEMEVPIGWQVEETIAGLQMKSSEEKLVATMRSVPVGQNTGGKEFPIESYSHNEKKIMLAEILKSVSQNNEDFQIDTSGYTRTKAGQTATYFCGRTESGGAYSLTFIWKENFIIVTAEASSIESFERNKYGMENIVKTIRTR